MSIELLVSLKVDKRDGPGPRVIVRADENGTDALVISGPGMFGQLVGIESGPHSYRPPVDLEKMVEEGANAAKIRKHLDGKFLFYIDEDDEEPGAVSVLPYPVGSVEIR